MSESKYYTRNTGEHVIEFLNSKGNLCKYILWYESKRWHMKRIGSAGLCISYEIGVENGMN